VTIILDGRAMTDRSAAHSHLAQRLGLPGYYGRNLDALYDALTEISTDTRIILEESGAVTESLGSYGEALLETLRDAAGENPGLTVTMK